jgi:dGTPase
VDVLQSQLNKFIYQRIIFHPDLRGTDQGACEVLRSLFRAYYEDRELLPTQSSFFAGWLGQRTSAEERPRGIADFIAGMTDSFALTEFARLQRRGLPLPHVDLDALRLPRRS